MEAGLEHLSRSGGTLAHADVLLVVMEPTRKSVLTAARTIALAADLGLHRVYGVGNKARLPDDEAWFRAAAAEQGVPLAGIIPLDPAVSAADRDGSAVSLLGAGPATDAADALVDFLDQLRVPA
jgi:CO dehydrogenase maturation factor